MIDQKKKVPCASAVGSKISAQERSALTQLKYPGYFGRILVQQQITGMELQNVFAILQSIVGLMLSKKGTCLSKDCEYKKLSFGEMFSETHSSS